jgi:hypothetical protein
MLALILRFNSLAIDLVGPSYQPLALARGFLDLLRV